MNPSSQNLERRSRVKESTRGKRYKTKLEKITQKRAKR
jgi:hypothetical protein